MGKNSGLVIGVLLFIMILVGSCECKNTASLSGINDSVEVVRQEFYQKYNSIYRNIGGDIWIFPIDGQYRMAEPKTSLEDRSILERYRQFIEIRGWNSEEEDIELTPDNIDEVLKYCIDNAN